MHGGLPFFFLHKIDIHINFEYCRKLIKTKSTLYSCIFWLQNNCWCARARAVPEWLWCYSFQCFQVSQALNTFRMRMRACLVSLVIILFCFQTCAVCALYFVPILFLTLFRVIQFHGRLYFGVSSCVEARDESMGMRNRAFGKDPEFRIEVEKDDSWIGLSSEKDLQMLKKSTQLHKVWPDHCSK